MNKIVKDNIISIRLARTNDNPKILFKLHLSVLLADGRTYENMGLYSIHDDISNFDSSVPFRAINESFNQIKKDGYWEITSKDTLFYDGEGNIQEEFDKKTVKETKITTIQKFYIHPSNKFKPVENVFEGEK